MQVSLPKQSVSRLMREIEPQRLVANLTAGLVVGFLCVIISVSLGALVYSGPLSEFQPRGIGLALLSTLLVSLTVALFSSLPGMVANMQDAPAAILAVTALSIASGMTAAPEAVFMTVVATSGVTTLAVGGLFIVVGTFRWGQLVRYLPYPVVGGFLAGTGWLLFTGGLGVLAGAPVNLGELQALFSAEALLRWLPGLAFAVVVLGVTNRVKHHLVWPGLIFSTVALFFLVMLFSGGSVEAWRLRGLLLGPFPDTGLFNPIDYRQLALVDWPLLVTHAASAATIIFISLMALLFNASGLELATGRKVNLNKELRTTGLGGLLAGAAGGMVGYQALSLTMLNYKVGTGSRLASFIAAVVVGTTLFFGATFVSFLPTLVVGGLLVFLGLSLLIEWVYGAFYKLPKLEYAIVLLIFLVIAGVGFLQGVGVGILAAALLFVITYSRTEVVKYALSGSTYRSRVSRGKSERQYLETHGAKLFILQLQGFIFFGTTNTILERISTRLEAAAPPAYILLDFRQVTGLDATALLGFGTLMQLAKQKDFMLILTGLMAPVSWQLEHDGIKPTPGEKLLVFTTLDEGLEWCETELLAASQYNHKQLSFAERLKSLMEEAISPSRLLSYFERLEVPPGHRLMKQGDAPDALYFLESGQVTARLSTEGRAPLRLETMRHGSVVGELGFYSGNVRSASVTADEASVVYRLTGEALARMTSQDPELAALFHKIMVRLLVDRVSHLMQVVEALQR